MSPTDESNAPAEQQVSSAHPQDAKQEEPARSYGYPHSTDHPPIAPVPDESEHEVQSYGGAPDGGT